MTEQKNDFRLQRKFRQTIISHGQEEKGKSLDKKVKKENSRKEKSRKIKSLESNWRNIVKKEMAVSL